MRENSASQSGCNVQRPLCFCYNVPTIFLEWSESCSSKNVAEKPHMRQEARGRGVVEPGKNTKLKVRLADLGLPSLHTRVYLTLCVCVSASASVCISITTAQCGKRLSRNNSNNNKNNYCNNNNNELQISKQQNRYFRPMCFESH